MQKIKMIIVAFVLMFSFSVVNAETISVRKIGNEDLRYSFDVKINHVLNEKNINVVKGVIYYDSDLITDIELVNSEDWKVKYISENDKVHFITYVIGNFAVNDDSLFNINVSINENMEEDKVSLLINDLVTTNGDNLFTFNKMEYKFQNLNALVNSEPEEIGVGQLNAWFDRIVEELKNNDDKDITENESSADEVVQNNGSSEIDKEDFDIENGEYIGDVSSDNNVDNLVVPDQDISNKIESSSNNTGLIMVIGFVFVLFVMLLLFNYVLYKVIMKNIGEVKELIKELKNKEVKDIDVIEKVTKPKRKRISSKKVTKKGDK